MAIPLFYLQVWGLLCACDIAFVRPIVSVMSTPVEAVDQTIVYLRICFIGIPFIVAYNVLSAIFRGMGDSTTPFYFIGVACIVNIALDFLFIGPMHMQAAGAALGTIFGQAVSVILAVIVIVKRKLLHLKRSDLQWDSQYIRSICQVGLPIAAQDGFIQISFF